MGASILDFMQEKGAECGKVLKRFFGIRIFERKHPCPPSLESPLHFFTHLILIKHCVHFTSDQSAPRVPITSALSKTRRRMQLNKAGLLLIAEGEDIHHEKSWGFSVKDVKKDLRHLGLH